MTLTHVAILAAVVVVLWFALDLILLVVAGVLLAILLRWLATGLADRTGLGTGASLALVLLAIAVVATLAGLLYAPRLAQEADQLTETVPAAFNDLTSWAREYEWGRWLLNEAQSSGSGEQVMRQATTAFQRLTDAAVALVVILFTGLYLAAAPAPYIRGVLRLVPLGGRERAAEMLFASGLVLRSWLRGQLVAMLVVGVSMGAGLALIGVPLSFLLGVLAGLFEFIPVVGPLIALGPALLLALADGTQQAAYVLLLYSIVQTGESYLLTPLVQQRAVELPPVLTIVSQVALSWLAGPMGLLVAVPLTAVAMVATQMLYVRDTLHDRLEPEWTREARAAVEEERTGMLDGVLPRASGTRETARAV